MLYFIVRIKLGTIKSAPFHSGFSRNSQISGSIYQNGATSVGKHWGNSIRKLFLNSNGVSVRINEETTYPLVMSLNNPEHGGLCVGSR